MYSLAERSRKPERKPAPEEEVAPYRARGIFENAIINAIGEELGEENQISSSDGPVSLKWLMDKDMPEGRFAIVQRHGISTAEEPGDYVWEEDKKTGERYMVKKLSGSAKPVEDMATFYELDTSQVRNIFNKLESAVKKSLLEELVDQIKENKNYIKKLETQLAGEPDNDKKEDLKKQIADEEEAQEKIKKQLEALA